MVMCALRCGPPPPPPPGLLLVSCVSPVCYYRRVCASVPGQPARLQSHSQARKPPRATQLLSRVQTKLEIVVQKRVEINTREEERKAKETRLLYCENASLITADLEPGSCFAVTAFVSSFHSVSR